MRLLVCGGRDFDNLPWLSSALSRIDDVWPFEVLICGMAKGADEQAHFWAMRKGIPVKEFPANWWDFGRAAGAIRNRQMLREGKPNLVIAFPGGKGTANMIAQARAANIEVWVMDGTPIEATLKERIARSAGIRGAR